MGRDRWTSSVQPRLDVRIPLRDDGWIQGRTHKGEDGVVMEVEEPEPKKLEKRMIFFSSLLGD